MTLFIKAVRMFCHGLQNNLDLNSTDEIRPLMMENRFPAWSGSDPPNIIDEKPLRSSNYRYWIIINIISFATYKSSLIMNAYSKTTAVNT